MDLEQVYISAVAFCAVFVMLTVLAGLMSLLTRVFPGKPPEPKKRRKPAAAKGAGTEPELVAAVNAAVTTSIPGGRVTKIEEVR
jgi:Na+-transporting methylmalonyl-CoA/oxaloacetate decarboxylase gamma subunit